MPGIMLGTENTALNSQKIRKRCLYSSYLICLLLFSFKPTLVKLHLHYPSATVFIKVTSKCQSRQTILSPNLLDLLAVFHTIAHSILLEMFSSLDFRDITPSWFSSLNGAGVDSLLSPQFP